MLFAGFLNFPPCQATLGRKCDALLTLHLFHWNADGFMNTVKRTEGVFPCPTCIACPSLAAMLIALSSCNLRQRFSDAQLTLANLA